MDKRRIFSVLMVRKLLILLAFYVMIKGVEADVLWKNVCAVIGFLALFLGLSLANLQMLKKLKMDKQESKSENHNEE